MKVNNPLLGADIEMFLQHYASGEVVSAEGYVKGTKYEPFNFDPSNKFFATSLDNVAVEYCIPPVPITDADGFLNNIKKSIQYIESTLPEGLMTVNWPAARLDDRFLQTENAQTFGCEPDNCVWTKEPNPKPAADDPNLRSCGGHIHLGYYNPEMETSEELIKAFDLFIGVPSVLQEPDNKRKELYGKAGAFRFKDYGVEYRTISNYYAGDERLTRWLVKAAQRAVQAVNDGMDIDQYKDDIIEAINNNNKTVAGNLIRSLDMELA